MKNKAKVLFVLIMAPIILGVQGIVAVAVVSVVISAVVLAVSAALRFARKRGGSPVATSESKQLATEEVSSAEAA
jgi:hypothetical protein